MAEGAENKRKRGIEIDWNSLFDSGARDEEPLPVVVIGKGLRQPKQVETPIVDSDQSEQDLRLLTDKELQEYIAKLKTTLIPSFSPKLPDRGEKLRARLKACETEDARRKTQKGDGKINAISLVDFPTHDANVDSPNGASHLEPAPKSAFAQHLCSKLDENATKSFNGELSTLNQRRHAYECSPSERARSISLSSKPTPFKSPWNVSVDSHVSNQENVHLPSTHHSASRTDLSGKDVLDLGKRADTQSRCRWATGKNKSVVLVDEEELDMGIAWEDVHSGKDSRIYYPSRDDPEAIEIEASELKTLAPEQYLSSTIMNFYIVYLQKKASTEGKTLCDYHFFNTYFYEKLKRDVLNKADRKASFKKFRRWWKGVNLFEKSYIFLPICEIEHWSLVIICIPSKESDSGPIVLHMDSLEYHASASIFRDVKSFLIEEWEFLRQEELPSGHPIANHIWERLSRRIEEKVVKVPQQENVYDCGLFVLYFLELFIEAAPSRLKKKELSMFGRQWFKPEEASSLRLRIKELLLHEFISQTKKELVN